jgi:uncharacterized protein with FMN-binding domain
MALAGTAAIGAAWLTGLHPAPTVALGPQAGATQNGAAQPVPTTPKQAQNAAPKGKHSTHSRAAKPPARSGSVDGPAVDTQYGAVQVRIVFSGKRITNVVALHLTDSSGHSVAISAGAAPTLREEALAAQSAHIDVVSGATYTSEAYQQSLQAAIDAAHLA